MFHLKFYLQVVYWIVLSLFIYFFLWNEHASTRIILWVSYAAQPQDDSGVIRLRMELLGEMFVRIDCRPLHAGCVENHTKLRMFVGHSFRIKTIRTEAILPNSAKTSKICAGCRQSQWCSRPRSPKVAKNSNYVPIGLNTVSDVSGTIRATFGGKIHPEPLFVWGKLGSDYSM